MIEPLYQPKITERQLSLRALIPGILIGSLISMINIYFALQIGWSIGAGLISAILGFAICKPLFPDYTVLENNITETAGSSAGAMSTACGLMALVPALEMLGHPMTLQSLYLWGFSVALLGIFFIVPLRKQMILIDQLRFPSAIATAETILVMHQGYDNTQAKTLCRFASLAGLLTLLTYFIKPLQNMSVFNVVGLTSLTSWGASLLVSPMMFGAGMLMGFRIGASLLLGAGIAWGILGPMVTHFGWMTGPIFDYKTGVQAWLLWPGVTLMTVDSLTNFGLQLPQIIKRTFFRKRDPKVSEPDAIPKSWWLGGLGVSSLLAISSLYWFFNIPITLSIVGILLSGILAAIATRAAGETEINPISAVGKVTQLVFAGLSQELGIHNITGAGLSAAGATSAADMMGDLKTGYLLGASPRLQFLTQCIGAVFGILFSIPLYFLFKAAYQIGGPELPAPAAHAWKAFAEILSEGFAALPPHSEKAVLATAVITFLLALLRRHPNIGARCPSSTAMGIAFIVPAYFPICFFLGACTLVVWSRLKPDNATKAVYAVASGLVVGEGLMGIAKAIFSLLGIKPLIA